MKIKAEEIYMALFAGVGSVFVLWILYEFGKIAIQAIESPPFQAITIVSLFFLAVFCVVFIVRAFNR
jgi:uncharacterized membrane protein required for colicin V production